MYTKNRMNSINKKTFRKKMHFKAALFDLDGTLLNTLDDLADSANTALKKMGYAIHPTDSYRYFVGDGMRTLIERIVPVGSSDESITACEGVFKEVYSKHWSDKTCQYKGIESMLCQLKAKGKMLAILSNKPDAFTRMCVKKYFPAELFSCVQGQLEGIPKKPHHQGALMVTEKLGLDPSDVLYIGDTATDMKTGKGAGMVTVGVLWGFRDIRELKENHADFIVRDPQEIVEICQ